uniref:RRM domain-containing protein n=1 Tax=Schistocephalus solidus TaxID=70667 RepID=A0A0X3NVL6_SCHSO
MLPFRCKSLELFKKSGKRNGVISFSTPEECGAAFDALQSFEYEGSKVIASFVQPRAKPPVPKPAELAKLLPSGKQEYCLNITNIPFSTSQEQLEESFPTAEHVIMRRRKDGKSKGSCMLSFSNADDCKSVLDACRHKEIDGRRIICTLGTSEELSALVAETIARGLPKRKLDLEGCQLKLFNVPYDTSERELKKIFPQSRHIFFPEVKGSPAGIALVTFKTPTICKVALKKASHLKLQNRKIRAEINVTIKKDKTMKKKGLEGEIKDEAHKGGTAEKRRKLKDGSQGANVRLHLSPDHDENQDQFRIAWSSEPAPPITS